ncbi:hypothetical protein [Microbacterium sp. NPDC058345]|uniref:hypothetical protein n=1 Tax=Microbacterium sp. NPDC058345 TaxID=3346455 RepID=UPI0036673897
MTNRHVVITGSAATDLHDLAIVLRQRRLPVTVQMHLGELPRNPVTMLIIAETFQAGMDWARWWEQDTRTRHAFDKTLPRLAPTGHGVLLGLSDTDEASARDEIRAGMRSLIGAFSSHAASVGGVDFVMNGIEVPPSHDPVLLTRRLEEHAVRSRLLADHFVIAYEDLIEQTVAQATTTDFI